MKVLNFTAVEILPSLLNKTKTQTIRPSQKPSDNYYYDRKMIDKQPRFKVGEEVRLEWKSRSSPKDSWFCSHCGMVSEVATATKGMNFGGCPQPNMKTIPAYAFPKILGYGKITEAFELNSDEWMEDAEADKLAERDGFKDFRAMWEWFDRHYDLKTPRKFWVYRFEWVK